MAYGADLYRFLSIGSVGQLSVFEILGGDTSGFWHFLGDWISKASSLVSLVPHVEEAEA